MEKQVLEILKNLFELGTIDKTCSQQTCDKWDSMGQLNLAVELESEFNVILEPEDVAKMTSVEMIIKILKTKGLKDNL